MRSEYDEDAYDTLRRAEQDEDERRLLWRSLAVYHHVDWEDHYLRYCAFLGLNAETEEAERVYTLTHFAYAAAWRKYGWDVLQTMIRIGWGAALRKRSLT